MLFFHIWTQQATLISSFRKAIFQNTRGGILMMIAQSFLLKKSAKLRALRSKNVLACQLALRAYVLTCQRALRAHVPTCLACLRAHVPTCLACLHAHVRTCLECLRAHVLTCLACLCAHVSCVLTCSCVNVPSSVMLVYI